MSTRTYIRDFLNRGGVSVFLSTAVTKFSAAILSITVVRLMSKSDYGLLAYALSIYGMGVVITGFGGQYSLLRFGSLLKSQNQKREYYSHTMKQAVKKTLLVALAVILSVFTQLHPNGSEWLIVLTGLSLVSFFVIELQRSYFRILNLNRLFSRVNIVYSIALFVIVIALTYLLGKIGYMIAFVIAPIIVWKYFDRQHFKVNDNSEFPEGYWAYGMHTSIGLVANQVIFSIAPFLLGLLGANESDIADFKVATIIPFNLLTIPGIIMITDFNYISKNYMTKDVLVDYYRNYLKVVIPVMTLIFAPFMIFGKYIIVFLFGKQFIDCCFFYELFMFATYFTFFFRNPLGNILLAVGKSSWNCYNAYISCFIYILFTILSYSFWGVYSAVYGLCGTFIISGFISLYFFNKYIFSITK